MFKNGIRGRCFRISRANREQQNTFRMGYPTGSFGSLRLCKCVYEKRKPISLMSVVLCINCLDQVERRPTALCFFNEQEGIWNAFSAFGALYLVKVCPNAALAEPGFYAMVKFYSSTQASKAQKATDKTCLFQRSPVKVNSSAFINLA